MLCVTTGSRLSIVLILCGWIYLAFSPPENAVQQDSPQGLTKISSVSTVKQEINSKVGIEQHVRPKLSCLEVHLIVCCLLFRFRWREFPSGRGERLCERNNIKLVYAWSIFTLLCLVTLPKTVTTKLMNFT